ncbi:hypothetical protein P168DRAFT_288497 [Aspergillus campestris IBT 28561]|uniref:Uncharacterized protein n=1 Tax=Aspergillus campestris (strain IBT 28561) TaxID=1392248 RepID=A0A2I1D9J3_ASPC2|nr:uncharacterized protein P168DRAFT_288497 [Aspergillus campestris IBT 28561]PKY06561.1 hypothetical protein P168DRAFT_288497 [Aspergillus campestris IBT 28561]
MGPRLKAPVGDLTLITPGSALLWTGGPLVRPELNQPPTRLTGIIYLLVLTIHGDPTLDFSGCLVDRIPYGVMVPGRFYLFLLI